MRHLNLELEKLEQRIAPGVVGGCGSHSKSGSKSGSHGSKSHGSKSHGSKSHGSKSNGSWEFVRYQRAWVWQLLSFRRSRALHRAAVRWKDADRHRPEARGRKV